jgi:hypothetical protein
VLGQILAGGFSAFCFLPLLYPPAIAAPVSDLGQDDFETPSSSPQLPSPSEEPISRGESHDNEAVVTPLPQPNYPEHPSPDLTKINIPIWRIPLISQRAYLSGGDKKDTFFISGSLPLDMQQPFDIGPSLRQAEDFMAIRSLLEESLEKKTAAQIENPAASGWTDQFISTDANDGDGYVKTSRQSGTLGLSYFSSALETIGVTDSQRQLVRKAIVDLQKYITVSQPNSEDIILQNDAGPPPVTINFNKGEPQEKADKEPKDKIDYDDPALTAETPRSSTTEYIQIFSFDNLWEFMTSSVMIVFYILILALWAAWRYAIRRFI